MSSREYPNRDGHCGRVLPIPTDRRGCVVVVPVLTQYGVPLPSLPPWVGMTAQGLPGLKRGCVLMGGLPGEWALSSVHLPRGGVGAA